MKSINIISGMAILLAAMATPLLSGCAADVDSADATADEAVASNDSTTSPDAENIGTDSAALFGGYGCGCGWGGVGAGGFASDIGLFGLGGPISGFGALGFGFGCGICGAFKARPFNRYRRAPRRRGRSRASISRRGACVRRAYRAALFNRSPRA